MLFNDTPDQRQRMLLVRVRAFGAAAVCLLAVISPATTVNGFACAAGLALIALGSSWPRLQDSFPLTASPVMETLLAASIVGVAVNDLPQAMLYLLVPAFAAGLLMGLVGTVAYLLCALVVIVAVATALDNPLHITLSLLSPWLLTAGGSGLLGAWVQQMGDHKAAGDDAYDSARRLLGQLRTVARRLSAGLDPVGIAQQLLVEVSSALSDRCSAVLIRSEGGVLVPLTFRGADRLTAVSGDDPLVREVWGQESAAYRWSENGGERTLLVGLPLRAGSRIIGIVVAEVEAAPSASTLAGLQTTLDQHALPLDTALVFDEIRTIATADERRRLAREIHDGIAQEVASLGYVVDELVATSDDEAQRVGLRNLRSELTRMVSELRLSIFDLRSEVSAHTGVSAALSEYVRLVGTKAGMTVHLSLNEAPQRLRIEVETEMLRIAQEAVTNARRHSGAKNLWVTLAVDPPHATLTVTDDGHGIGPARSDSYGMKIMRERAQRIGADLMIASRPEGGTIVDLTLRPEHTGTIPTQPFAAPNSAMADPRSVAPATNDTPTVSAHTPGVPHRST
jgi:signal transduction histidine kinase